MSELHGVIDQLRRFGIEGRRMAKLACEKAGIDLISYAKSTTSELRPPVRASEGLRNAHPGGWADRTANLVNSYDSKVEQSEDVIVLSLENSREYAQYLDEKEDYWVLSGLIESGMAERVVTSELRAVLDHLSAKLSD